MSKAIQAAMSQQDFPESARISPQAPSRQQPPEPEELTRIERVGAAWRVREDALWNPFEVASNMLWIVLGFGFLLGRSNYVFAIELFAPVILLGVAVLLGQAVLRWFAGEAGVLSVMRTRIGLG